MLKNKPLTKYNENARQIIHIIATLAIAISYYYDIIKWSYIAILAILAIIFTFIYKKYEPKYLKIFIKYVERPNNIKTWPAKGATMLLIGIMLTILLFDKNLAVPALIILGFGDGIPPLITQKWHKYRFHLNKKKHWEGIIAGWITASIGASIFIWWPLAIVAAGVAVFIESLDITIGQIKLEDNIIMPLIAALILFLMI